MTEKIIKPKISPLEYKNILKGIDLLSISLKESKSFINTDITVSSDLNISIKDEAHYELKPDNEVYIYHKYNVDSRKPKSKSRYVQIEVTFLIRLNTKENFSDDFFEIYKNVSLHLNTWPYFREFVNQSTARMNIPPLTLPLYKTP